jgi:hypothetical protein
MDRMKKLTEAITTLVEGEFSGYLKINFTQGSLGRVEKSEEFEDAAVIFAAENNGKSRQIKAHRVE